MLAYSYMYILLNGPFHDTKETFSLKPLFDHKCRPRCFKGVSRIQMVFVVSSIEYRFGNESSLCNMKNLDTIKREITF